MLDIQSLKANIDLIALAGHSTELRKKTGNEYTGPCPFCGGRDRFNVQADKWLCRNCTDGKWQDVVDLVMRRDNVTFLEAVKILGGDTFTTDRPVQKPSHSTYTPPAQSWQESARDVIEVTRRQLLGDEGELARRWLTGRGLQPATVDRFGLGYSTGQEIAGLYVPPGVTIPCAVNGEIWYIKVRVNAIEYKRTGKKYPQVRGSKSNALFNADDLLFGCPALFVEGEFDCMLAAQEIGDVIIPVTFGAARNKPDLVTWGGFLARPGVCFISYDLDDKGEAGAFELAALLGDRAKLAPIPEGSGKDVTDYHRAGGDLWPWVRDLLAFYDPQPEGSPAELVKSMSLSC